MIPKHKIKMMWIKNRSVLIFSVFMVLLSCTDLNRATQLKKVARLNQQVDSLKQQMLVHRVDTMSELINAVSSIELRIKYNYTADTIDYKLVEKMNDFRRLKGFILPKHEEEGEKGEEGDNIALQSIGSAYTIVERGISSELDVLKNLHNDILNGSGKRDKYDDYIQFETTKVKQLSLLLENYIEHKNKILKNFKNVYDDLDAFASKLERINQTSTNQK
jgi:hypothetical protein